MSLSTRRWASGSVLALLFSVLASGGLDPASYSGTPTARAQVPAPSVPPALYRLVGCRRRGPTIAYRHGPRRRVVALTFDDGPWPDTAAFVRMLEQNHVPATFFLIGEQVRSRYRATLLRELRDGDALGDHTFTHPFLTRTGNVHAELSKTLVAIRGLSGYTPCVFRPPSGDYNSSVTRAAGALGMATILWEVDPSDYALPGSAAIEQRVLAQARAGSIILSHDGGGPRGQTLAAYPRIISRLRARGYRFETVPALLGFHPVYRRCLKQCDGLGVRGPLPRGSIIENG